MDYRPRNSFSMSYASRKVIFPGDHIYAHSAIDHQLNPISATKYLQHSWISYTHMCNSYVASSLAGCPYLVSGTSPTHQLRILPGRIPSQPSGHLGQGDIPLTNGISSWSGGELDRWGRTYFIFYVVFRTTISITASYLAHHRYQSQDLRLTCQF